MSDRDTPDSITDLLGTEIEAAQRELFDELKAIEQDIAAYGGSK